MSVSASPCASLPDDDVLSYDPEGNVLPLEWPGHQLTFEEIVQAGSSQRLPDGGHAYVNAFYRHNPETDDLNLHTRVHWLEPSLDRPGHMVETAVFERINQYPELIGVGNTTAERIRGVLSRYNIMHLGS